MEKRTFLKKTLLAFAGSMAASTGLEKALHYADTQSPNKLASDEDFWSQIRGMYRLKPDYINLENGYYCFIPEPTLDRYIAHIKEVNYQGSYYMRTVQFENRKKMAAKLAAVVGAKPEEVGITRNTTESLDLIIGGYPWKAGDEAIMAEQDYGSMLTMFKMASDRYGMKIKMLSVPNHPKSDEEIVSLYESAITPNTRLIMVSHMVNITGQILPIRKICDMAHKRGVEVMVDGAHCVGHFEFNMEELNCDYYGASLHKWLSVPLGAGLLFVKQEKQQKIWPLLASFSYPNDDGTISRLNHIGTHPVHTELAVSDAIDFYNMIGPKRKEERLRYLQQYWTSRVKDLDGIVLNTPTDPQRACGIANVGIAGMKPAEMSKRLLDDHKIWTVAIDNPSVKGCRITPNIYTSLDELDAFVEALKVLSKS